MKIVLTAVGLLMSSPLMVIEKTAGDDAAPPGEATAIVKVVQIGADGEPGVVQTLNWTGEGDAECDDGRAVVVVRGGGETDDAGRRIKVLTRVATKDGDGDRGWLGVALGEVSEDLAAEHGVAEGGAVVLNVVKESPAEAAGLLENDVVVSVNGEPIEGGVAAVAKRIGELGPGAEVRLTVVRNGASMDLAAVLTAPKQGHVEWLYAPDVEFKDYTRFHPRIWKFLPKGKMQAFDVDHLEALEDLPAALADAFSKVGVTTQLSLNDDRRTLKIVNNQDGQVIEINQEGDGPIVVKRYTDGEDDVEQVEYATADDLKAGDEEAFDLYDRSSASAVFIGKDGSGYDFDVDVNLDMDDLMTEDFKKRFEIKIEKAHEALEDAARHIHGPHSDADAGLPDFAAAFIHGSKATHSFKVTPDGAIELTIRKGDSEVIKVYEDDADLKARNPDAYERYLDVIEGEPQE